MDKLRPAARVALITAGNAVIGGIAWATVSVSVTPGPWRDAVLLALWPLLIVSGTVLAWRWLGKGGTGEADVAFTRTIEEGRRLRSRLAATPDEQTDDEQSAWKVRVKDWADTAREIVSGYAPDRLPAFKLDVLVSDYTVAAVPKWKASLLTDLDVLIDRLMVLRVSL